MDDLMDPFLSSLSWAELNTSSRLLWASSIASQANGLLTDSVETYVGDEKDPPICMIPSPHIMGNIPVEDLDLYAHSDNSSVFTDGNLKYMSQHELPTHNSHPLHDKEAHKSNISLKDAFESNSTSGSYGTTTSSIESNGSEPSKFAQSLGDAHSISSVPSIWTPSYAGVSYFIEQGKPQGFSFQGVENDADELGKTYIENDKYTNPNNSAAASVHDCNGLHSHFPNFTLERQMKMTNGSSPHQQDQNGMHNLHLPSFTARPQMTLSKLHGVQARQQSTEGNTLKHQTNSAAQHQVTPVNNNACNGTAKPRVRARRGQATDPHSIAERLRREKIAERMKNLQELVPNSNKTDKTSMLDEIIDYVKFLQLQVKVLSMSRLGAAGAVVPLITDAQAEVALSRLRESCTSLAPSSAGLAFEDSGTLHLSSVGQGEADLSAAQDNLAFEQEVVKLMESNVTTAMQYLQNKGLCLMPIALAAAISSQKGSSSATIPPDRRKTDVSHGVVSQSNGRSLAERILRENGGHNGCNGGVIKKEEGVKSV